MHVLLTEGDDGPMVDHWDGDGLNNRRRNIRRCTPAENCANARIRTDNQSGYRGVSRHTQNPKWIAHIKNRYIGTFNDPEAAARAYDAAATKEFGEFARLNFPDG